MFQQVQLLASNFIAILKKNLINNLFFCRVHASLEWVQSQIPDIVKNGVERLGDETSDMDDMDAEVYVQAYVNIVAGACMSLGKILFMRKCI